MSQSRLIALPAEIRHRIWEYCIPSEETLPVKLCPESAESDLAPPTVSPVAQIMKQMQQLQLVLTELGLKLRITNQQIRAESLPLFATKIVRFCCPSCFGTFLKYLKACGVGIFWMTHVEVVVDLQRRFPGTRMNLAPVVQGGRAPPDRAFIRMHLRREMLEIQKIAYLYYGRLDLMERAVWEIREELEPHALQHVISGWLRT